MLDCHSLNFSVIHSQKRINIANSILGPKTVKIVIAFALYLLGAAKKSLAESLNMPYETLKSVTNRILKDGITAIEDRRYKRYSMPTCPTILLLNPSVSLQRDELVIDFGADNLIMKIPKQNTLQIKTILLTMLANKMINVQTVMKILGYTKSYIFKLSSDILKGDVGVLVDKRQGQKQDFIFSPEIKAELIQQVSANAICGKSTSGRMLADEIKQRCDLDLSDRTIRHHIKKLGLSTVNKNLPILVNSIKKKSNQ